MIHDSTDMTIHLDSIRSYVIPDTVFSFTSLKKLKIIGSNKESTQKYKYHLNSIPHKIWRLKNLEEIDLSEHKNVSFPKTIIGLSKLKKIYLRNKLTNDETKILEAMIPEKCNIIIEN